MDYFVVFVVLVPGCCFGSFGCCFAMLAFLLFSEIHLQPENGVFSLYGLLFVRLCSGFVLALPLLSVLFLLLLLHVVSVPLAPD